MCEFCKDEDITEICKKTINFGQFGKADLTLDMTQKNIYANLSGLGDLQLNVEIRKPIKFCPFCGRKLNGE